MRYQEFAEEADKEVNLRLQHMLRVMRARYPGARNDLEALMLMFNRDQERDRRDISRLDQENDQEEADIAAIERYLDQRDRKRDAVTQEGKKDACYNKVRSRYKVWPSAYASGALVQCRKKGAKNWGNKGK
jgi:cation transport regulator ChaB